MKPALAVNFAMLKQLINFSIHVFKSLVLLCFSFNLNLGDVSQPLNTKDFYKQIYSHVCPAGELSCLREVMTSSFQLSLPRNKGEKIGSMEKVYLSESKESIVKTLSHNPPIFEIEDFFTEEECELVIDLAKAKGMKKTAAFKNIQSMFKDEIHETFKMWNLNGDEFVDANEISYVYGKAGVFATERIIFKMFETTKIDKNNDGKLDEKEFENMDQQTAEKFLDEYLASAETSKVNDVFTQEAWLWHNEDELLAYEDLFEDYHERVAKLTKLPRKIIEHSEPIQVVKYENDAYYDCHHDTQSLSNDLPCCQYGSSNCRLCRYLTIMVYLTDDYEGGEKCFPLADNNTFSQKDLPKDYLKKCNLAESCDACNILVKPKRGKAVMWYNHLLNTRSAWMGALDAFSGHGDCVSHGDKWIANIWIDIIGDGKHELRSWKSGINWIKPGIKNIDIYTALGNPSLKPKSDFTLFKERYSPTMNTRPDTKNGNVRVHLNNHYNENSATKSVKDIPGATQSTSVKHSNVLKSVLLLLNELMEDELDIVADNLGRKLSSAPFAEWWVTSKADK